MAYDVEQGCPSFFLGGPLSELGHKQRSTYLIHIMKMKVSREDGKMSILTSQQESIYIYIPKVYIRKYIYVPTNEQCELLPCLQSY